MNSPDAQHDLRFIRNVLERTCRRIDPHAAHFVAWGLIVLVWYPAMNAFELAGNGAAMATISAAALLTGIVSSVLVEYRLKRNPPPEGEDTFVGRQVVKVVYGCLAAAIVLSVAGPMLRIFEGHSVSIVWGFAYAVMAYMVGVVYQPEYMVAGAGIFVASVAAMALPAYAGFILGPAMGLGMIVPGVMAKRRVARGVETVDAIA
jgi:hypothetical protein